MSIKMSAKVNKCNGLVVIMPEIFKNIKCKFNDYEISFDYKNMQFIVDINSNSLNDKDLENIFWDFYSYLGIILGYFPSIIEATFMDEKYLANIVEQYKTKDCYIRASEQYIKSLNEDQFRMSFTDFRRINKKANFTLSMFNISMMESIHYPEIAVINLLQSLDGLYEEIFSNEINNKKIKYQKLNYIKDILNTLDIENINNVDYENVKRYMQKISEITFIDKLRLFTTLTKYDVFKHERQLDKNDKYSFENLLSKFVNTRNKFSHSVNKKDVLNGTESAVYIFKIIMLYRLLIIDKIGLSDSLNEKEFLYNLKEWDEYIVKTLKEEEDNV